MNKDQIKGRIKVVAGKVQAQTGHAVGSTSQEVKGHAREAAGVVQKTVGDAKAQVKAAVHHKG